MLIPTDTFFMNNGSIPKTENERIIQILYKKFSKKSWFKRLYQDVSTTSKSYYLVKCNYQIDVDEYPSQIDGWQIKYTWDSKKDLTIHEAADKFKNKFKNYQWFYDVKVLDGKIIEVVLKSWLNLKNRFDYYENYPVQYGLLQEETDNN